MMRPAPPVSWVTAAAPLPREAMAAISSELIFLATASSSVKLVGTLTPDGVGIDLCAINSCLQLLPALDGKAPVVKVS